MHNINFIYSCAFATLLNMLPVQPQAGRGGVYAARGEGDTARMAEFYLVRHGQASFGAANYDQLSPLGHQQSQWLGEYFAERNIHFDAMVTGELVRHRETAEGICRGMGHELEADVRAGLNEFDFQAVVSACIQQHPEMCPVEGAPRSAFYRLLKIAMQKWREEALTGELPETWAHFSERVAQVLAHLQQSYAEHERVLLVTSGGAIAMALKHILGTADETVVELNLQTRNAGVTQGFFNSRVIRLTAFNQVPHLDRPDRPGAITFS